MSTTQETATTPFGNSSRRTFLKWSGVAGGTAALVSTVTDLGMIGNGDLEQAVCGQRRIRG